jgi:predicted TPR repeat methyltransferase
MHHHLATLLLKGKLHVAPIGTNPQRILDLGCGTGIWAIDIGISSFYIHQIPLFVPKALGMS